MVFKSLTLFLICLLAKINTNNHGTTNKDELDINIDVSNLVAEFDEKINYSLKVKDNDINVQKIEKILPDLDDNRFFNLQVTSEKAYIKKFEIIEINDPQNKNKKKKILLIEYQLKKNAFVNFNENSVSKDQYVTDIDFCICFKTKDFQVVKNKIYLRDVPFSNIDNSDENLKLKINLFNLPKNADVKKIDITKDDNFNADMPIVGNNKGNNVNAKNNFNLKNRNENHHKFRLNEANNQHNKVNNGDIGKDNYSFKYDETFHKDSIAFLSINLTMVNKTELINNAISLTENVDKKEKTKNKIKKNYSNVETRNNTDVKNRIIDKIKEEKYSNYIMENTPSQSNVYMSIYNS